jgi:hypothetical protein
MSIVNGARRTAGALIVLFSIGCGSPPADAPKAELHLYSGIVKVDGKPIKGAQVSLHPVGSSTLGVVTPNGVTDENGLFVLTTYNPADGAPEGKYKATVSWADVINATSSDPEYGPEKLPARYQDKEQSGLEVEVKGEATDSAVLELTSV